MSNSVESRGLFVVIEGIDGAGTTTQAERYAAHLRARGRAVHVTQEPTAGPVGALIRRILAGGLALPEGTSAPQLALLFAADRLDHLAREVDPALARGEVVICDRYDLSSLVYQSASATRSPAGRADLTRWIRELNRFARRPDVTVVLDVSPAVAAGRRRERGGGRELFDDAALQCDLAEAYWMAETLVPRDRVVHVPGDMDPATVTAAIARQVDPLVFGEHAEGA